MWEMIIRLLIGSLWIWVMLASFQDGYCLLRKKKIALRKFSGLSILSTFRYRHPYVLKRVEEVTEYYEQKEQLLLGVKQVAEGFLMLFIMPFLSLVMLKDNQTVHAFLAARMNITTRIFAIGLLTNVIIEIISLLYLRKQEKR